MLVVHFVQYSLLENSSHSFFSADIKSITKMKKFTAFSVIGTAFFVAWTRYRLQLWERAILTLHDDLLLHGEPILLVDDVAWPRQSSGDLPMVVQRYLSEAIRLPVGTEIRSARLSQRGTFQTKPGVWSSFTAEQLISVNPPGFVWDASIAMFPSLDRWPMIQVCDAWTQGKATLKVALMNVWEISPLGHPVEDRERRHRIDKELEIGEAMRWLAEAFLVPTSLSPKSGLVVWVPVILPDGTVSRTQALLHLHDSFQLPEVRLLVTFDDAFKLPIKIEGFRPKWVEDSQTFDIVEWQGFFEEFQQLDVGGENAAVLVPAHMKVGWIQPSTGDLELYFEGINYDPHFDFKVVAEPKPVVEAELFTTIE